MQKLIAKDQQVGDFTVRRALPQIGRRFVGPFCFLDHMGPHTAVAVANGGVAPHPHIGLATVTYLFDGEVLHRDSLGTVQRIVPGDVNWMQAGRGIVHSERTPPGLVGQTTTLHGLQIWVGLPTAEEETAPSFQHVAKADLPHSDGVRVVLGAWQGARSPVKLASPAVYVVAELPAGATFPIPREQPEQALYVVSGSITLDGAPFTAGELAVLDAPATATATTPAQIALIGGEPLDGPRFMSWNFVSSRKDRLEQAHADWNGHRFPTVPGDP